MLLLLLDAKTLFCVPACVTLQDWWLFVAEVFKMHLPGS